MKKNHKKTEKQKNEKEKKMEQTQLTDEDMVHSIHTTWALHRTNIFSFFSFDYEICNEPNNKQPRNRILK